MTLARVAGIHRRRRGWEKKCRRIMNKINVRRPDESVPSWETELFYILFLCRQLELRCFLSDDGKDVPSFVTNLCEESVRLEVDQNENS